MANDNESRTGAKQPPSFDSLKRWIHDARERVSIDRFSPPIDRLCSHLSQADRLPGQNFKADIVSDRLRSGWLSAQAAWQRLLTPAEPASAASDAGRELQIVARDYRNAFVGLGVASGFINLLSLTGPLFMLQIYDRVLPSRSLPTLVGLGLLALAMFGFQGALDLLRGRLLLRTGRGLNERLSPRVFDIVMRLPLQGRPAGDGLQSIRDLDNLRSFTSSIGLIALFDLPWMPLYVLVCFLFHPWIGFSVLFGAVIICSLTLATEGWTRAPSRAAVTLAGSRNVLAESARRNAAVIHALGMRGRMTQMWSDVNESYLATHQSASDMVTAFGSLSRVLRMIMQSAVLGVGAYLVIIQEATAGVMLAATILSTRALAPV